MLIIKQIIPFIVTSLASSLLTLAILFPSYQNLLNDHKQLIISHNQMLTLLEQTKVLLSLKNNNVPLLQENFDLPLVDSQFLATVIGTICCSILLFVWLSPYSVLYIPKALTFTSLSNGFTCSHAPNFQMSVTNDVLSIQTSQLTNLSLCITHQERLLGRLIHEIAQETSVKQTMMEIQDKLISLEAIIQQYPSSSFFDALLGILS